MLKFMITAIVIVAFSNIVSGQIGAPNMGIPHIQNYSPKIYKQHEQNWAAVQDQRGIMYFGNSHGLLEYDGTSWRLIPTMNPHIVRALAVTANNELYLGGYNYFGKMIHDSSGTLSFAPLSDKLPVASQIFASVRNISILDGAVFFQTDSALFRWKDNVFKIWKSIYPFNHAFVIRDTLYRVIKDTGLVYLDGEFFRPVQDAGVFATLQIRSMIPLGTNSTLLATRNSGFFVRTDNRILPFKTELDNFLKDNILTAVVFLKDGNIAISTVQSGIIIMDQKGHLINTIDKSKGLADNTVWSIQADDQYGLWLMLNNGIARIELPAAATYFDEKAGIEGTVESIVYHQGILYIATPMGLYYLHPAQTGSEISKIPEFRPYKLVSAGKSLLAAGYTSGTYELVNSKLNLISDYTASCFRRSVLDSNRVYVGLDEGLASLYWKNNHWTEEGIIELHASPVRDIVETTEGDLWIGTNGPVICRIHFLDGRFSILQSTVTKFDNNSGLLPAQQNFVFPFRQQVLIGNKNRLLEYDTVENNFKLFTPLNNIFTDTTVSVHELVKDRNNNLWIATTGQAGEAVGVAILQPDANYRWDTVPCLPLADNYFYVICPDPGREGIIWLGGPDGMIRFNAQVQKDYKLDYPCLIRHVRIQQDSLIWNGENTSSLQDSIVRYPSALSYEFNTLQFEFTALFYEHETANRYQYFLEGFDRNWSQWTEDHKAIYTNIPEGTYNFRVRARNIYGHNSREGIFTFEILPPWYRSLPAYAIYILLVTFLIIGLVKLRSRQLEKEKRELEVIINERTTEIQSKNKQLAEQTLKLQELDHIKSRFFANISHEFRTPLTLIIGPVEEMLAGIFKGDPKKIYHIILRNARRLLQLINQLLDLSRLESGTMTLQASLQPFTPFLKAIVYSFSSLAETRQIHLQYTDSTDNTDLYFDRDKLEKIIYNLLSNAFKFTPPNGFITVSVTEVAPATDGFSRGAVQISIHDSGSGISKDQLPFIFDRFYQGGNAKEHMTGGSGIGLSLVKDLVELHHGKINVQSELGIGSEFDVLLPKGKNHLQPDEIAEQQETGEVSTVKMDRDSSGINQIEPEPTMDNKTTNDMGKTLLLVVEDNTDVRNYICCKSSKTLGLKFRFS